MLKVKIPTFNSRLTEMTQFCDITDAYKEEHRTLYNGNPSDIIKPSL
jgi:hypothetical protein